MNRHSESPASCYHDEQPTQQRQVRLLDGRESSIHVGLIVIGMGLLFHAAWNNMTPASGADEYGDALGTRSRSNRLTMPILLNTLLNPRDDEENSK